MTTIRLDSFVCDSRPIIRKEERFGQFNVCVCALVANNLLHRETKMRCGADIWLVRPEKKGGALLKRHQAIGA